MSILSGIRKQKKYITDANGDHTLVSEWTNTDTVDLATDIVNNEHTLAEATEWDDTYDDVSTQPTGMSELVSKMTTTFNNTKYLQNQNESTKTILSELIDIAHPIGSLYWSSDPTDPGTLPGWEGTTWERIKDRFIYAMGDGDRVEEKGGQPSVSLRIDGTTEGHTLTGDEIPQHRHTASIASVSAIQYTEYSEGTGLSFRYVDRISTGSGYTGYAGGSRPHEHDIDITTSVPIKPPYINYYCWKRTA